MKLGHGGSGFSSAPAIRWLRGTGCADCETACPRRRDQDRSNIWYADSYAPAGGITFAKRWLDQKRGRAATAIACGNDDLAIGFLRTILQRGVRVPADISVTGFDGVPEGALYWPGLTTVDQPSHEMGKAACRTLLRVVEGPEPAPRRNEPTCLAGHRARKHDRSVDCNLRSPATGP